MNRLSLLETIQPGNVPGLAPGRYELKDITTASDHLKDGIDAFAQRVERLQNLKDQFLAAGSGEKPQIAKQINNCLREISEPNNEVTEPSVDNVTAILISLGRYADQTKIGDIAKHCKENLPDGSVPSWVSGEGDNLDPTLAAKDTFEDRFYAATSSCASASDLSKFHLSAGILENIREELLADSEARRLTHIKNQKLGLINSVSTACSAAWLRTMEPSIPEIDTVVREEFLGNATPRNVESTSQLEARAPVQRPDRDSFTTQERQVVDDYKHKLAMMQKLFNEDLLEVAENGVPVHQSLTVLRDNSVNTFIDKMIYTIGGSKIGDNPDEIKPKFIGQKDIGTFLKKAYFGFASFVDAGPIEKTKRLFGAATKLAVMGAVAVGVVACVGTVGAVAGSLLTSWVGGAAAGAGAAAAGTTAATGSAASIFGTAALNGASAGGGILLGAAKAALFVATPLAKGAALIASTPALAWTAAVAGGVFMMVNEWTTKVRQTFNTVDVLMKGPRYHLKEDGKVWNKSVRKLRDRHRAIIEAITVDLTQYPRELFEAAASELAEDNPELFLSDVTADSLYKQLHHSIHEAQPMRMAHAVLGKMKGDSKVVEKVTDFYDNDGNTIYRRLHKKDPHVRGVADIEYSTLDTLNEYRKSFRLISEVADANVNNYEKIQDAALNSKYAVKDKKKDMSIPHAGITGGIMILNTILEKTENSAMSERFRFMPPGMRVVLDRTQETLPFLTLGEKMRKNAEAQDYLLNTVGEAFVHMKELTKVAMTSPQVSVSQMEEMATWTRILADSVDEMIPKASALHDDYLSDAVVREFFGAGMVGSKLHFGHLCDHIYQNIYDVRMSNQINYTGSDNRADTSMRDYIFRINEAQVNSGRVQKAKGETIGSDVLRASARLSAHKTPLREKNSKKGHAKIFNKEQAERNLQHAEGKNLDPIRGLFRKTCEVVGFNPMATATENIRITQDPSKLIYGRSMEGWATNERTKVRHTQIRGTDKLRRRKANANNEGVHTTAEDAVEHFAPHTYRNLMGEGSNFGERWANRGWKEEDANGNRVDPKDASNAFARNIRTDRNATATTVAPVEIGSSESMTTLARQMLEVSLRNNGAFNNAGR